MKNKYDVPPTEDEMAADALMILSAIAFVIWIVAQVH